MSLFVVFEGVDGSGKSTQSRILSDRLRAESVDVIQTREPGGTPGGENIRRLILEGQGDTFAPETEILLFNAARAEHMSELIIPALNEGKTVVSDRFALSTFAYQGMVSPEARDFAISVHELVVRKNPDLTLILEAPDAGKNLAKRIAAGGEENRLDAKTVNFQHELWAGMIGNSDYFRRTGDVVVIPYGSVDEVAEMVYGAYEVRVRSPHLTGIEGP